MIRKCPSCRSRNVRRSATPDAEVTWRNQLLSPYRCRDCQTQFQVVSRKTYIVAGSLVAAIVVAAIVVLLLELMVGEPSPAKGRRRSDVEQRERVVAAADVATSMGGGAERVAGCGPTTAA